MKTVSVRFDRIEGPLKPQHGYVNYPEKMVSFYGTPIGDSDANHLTGTVDAAEAMRTEALFQEIGCPVVRLKDPKQRGYGKKLEIPYVFRDFSKDPKDPANWYWYVTDPYIENLQKWHPGRTIIRLGAPREQWKAIFNNKPSDYAKFTEICLLYIRHINGKGEGELDAGVKYWQIWDRADSGYHWSDGTAEDYYRLYTDVAKAIRKEYPALKIGGPSPADSSGSNVFLRGFLQYVKAHEAPLDFVTWNYYGEDLKEAVRQAREVKRVIREAGLLGKVEIANDAWNCMTEGADGFFSVPHVADMQGAAFDAAFMIAMQKEGMDYCCYFECDRSLPWTGFVPNWFYRPLKPLYAFDAFARLYQTKNEARTIVKGTNLYALAGKDGERETVLVSVFQKRKDVVRIDFGSAKERNIYVLDESHDLRLLWTVAGREAEIPTNGYTVILAESVGR